MRNKQLFWRFVIKYSMMVFAIFALMDAPSLAMSQDVHSSKRPIRFEDFHSLEKFDGMFKVNRSISRDGAIAIGIERGWKDRAVYPSDGYDVWVKLAPGQSLTNITNGITDGSDWRIPVWSPSGDRLAITSNRGGNRAVWVWERGTNTLQQYCRQHEGKDFFEWIDNDNLLCVVILPNMDGKKQQGSIPEEMAGAITGWAKRAAGKESTASVLETGLVNTPVANVGQDSLRQLIVVNIKTKDSKTIMGPYQRQYYRNNASNIIINPTRRFIAIGRHGGFLGPIDTDAKAARVDFVIRSLAGQYVNLDGSLPKDVLWETPRWSPDGTELAYFAYGKSRNKSPHLVVVNVVTGNIQERYLDDIVVTQLRDGNYDFARLEWTEAGDILFKGSRAAVANVQGGRRDWWFIRRKGLLTDVPRLLTADMKVVPDFARYSLNGPLVALTDGKLWSVDAVSHSIRPVSTTIIQPIKAIIWPNSDIIVEGRSTSQKSVLTIAVDDGNKGGNRYFNIDVNTGSLMLLQKPTEGAVPLQSDELTQTVLWIESDKPKLWRTRFDKDKRELLVTLNPWQDSLELARDTIVEYVGIQGDKLKGWVRLPLGYEPGKKYPLIVQVYPGQKKGNKQESEWDFQLQAAAGFSVLVPSMPFVDYEVIDQPIKRDPYWGLGDGVYPAIDKLVEMGIADPDRVFVQGSSYGGYAVMGLVTQTNRFKAGVSDQGGANMISFDGTFSTEGRYTENIGSMAIGYGSHAFLPRPVRYTPWSDLAFFIRNSPITYAERVQTPIMLTHGDLDQAVPMTQSEEFFSALHRLGKRATFVRYWGEGHGYASPANQRDYLQRVFAWYDEFGDISRDAEGIMIFENDRVKSRGGRPALKSEQYAKFFFFGAGSKPTNMVTGASKISALVEAAIHKQ